MSKMASKRSDVSSDHNYLVEEHEDFAIVKSRKGNPDEELKVILFDDSIIQKLEDLKEKRMAHEKEEKSRVYEVLKRLKKLFNE